MGDVSYTPPPDDVEAAAKEIAPEARFDYGATWINLTNADDLVRTTIGVLHARGWRDPAEVAAIEKARDANARTINFTATKAKRAVDDAVASFKEVVLQRDAAIARAEAAEAQAAANLKAHAHDVAFVDRRRQEAEARAERLTAALAELVRLKGIKERLESWRLSPIDTEQERDDLWKHYECCKDLAWSDAREALAADTAEKETRE